MSLDVIVCALDHSDPAQRAARFAAEMSVRTGARLVLVSVRRVTMDRSSLGGTETPESVDMLLAEAEEIARSAGCMRSTRVQLHGADVAEVLASYVEENGAQLVVMGCKVKSAMKRIALGSTPMNFIRHSTCPVTLVQ